MVDFSKYGEEGPFEAYFGLPEKVEFCKTCVISNQRPNSTIEQKHTRDTKKQVIAFKDGICDACRAKETKEVVDWNAREKELIELCDRYRSKNNSYDCLVPGSGGKDSFYQAHVLKYKYGMNPLTVTWAPHLYTDWGWKNFQAWINAGFDNILVSPNRLIHRLLTRLSMERLLHPFQPFIIGQRSLAAKIAAQNDIQLIFYGESGSEYGNPAGENERALRDFREYEYFTMSDDSEVFLGGTSLKELKSEFGLKQHDFNPYFPIDPQLCEDKGIQVHYLGYYMKWHPQGAYYYAVANGGFQPAPERTLGTYSKYNSIDDKMDDYHYYTTFIKFGIGRATYDASQEIRSGEIDRDEGIALIKKFDGEYPGRFENELFEYMSITEKEFPQQIVSQFKNPVMNKETFVALCDDFRSPHLWKYENGNWKLRHAIYY